MLRCMYQFYDFPALAGDPSGSQRAHKDTCLNWRGYGDSARRVNLSTNPMKLGAFLRRRIEAPDLNRKDWVKRTYHWVKILLDIKINKSYLLFVTCRPFHLFSFNFKRGGYFWFLPFLVFIFGSYCSCTIAAANAECRTSLDPNALRSGHQSIQLNRWGFTIIPLEMFAEGSSLSAESEKIWLELSEISELSFSQNRGYLHVVNGMRPSSKLVAGSARPLLMGLAHKINLLLNGLVSPRQRYAKLDSGEVRLRLGTSPIDDSLDFHVDRDSAPNVVVIVPLIGKGPIVRYAGDWPEPEIISSVFPAWGRSHVELYKDFREISVNRNEILILSTTGAAEVLGVEPTVHSAPLTNPEERRMTVLFSYGLPSIAADNNHLSSSNYP